MAILLNFSQFTYINIGTVVIVYTKNCRYWIIFVKVIR